MERRKGRKAMEDAATPERNANIMANVFQLQGIMEASTAQPFPKHEVRKAIRQIGKAKLRYHAQGGL